MKQNKNNKLNKAKIEHMLEPIFDGTQEQWYKFKNNLKITNVTSGEEKQFNCRAQVASAGKPVYKVELLLSELFPNEISDSIPVTFYFDESSQLAGFPVPDTDIKQHELSNGCLKRMDAFVKAVKPRTPSSGVRIEFNFPDKGPMTKEYIETLITKLEDSGCQIAFEALNLRIKRVKYTTNGCPAIQWVNIAWRRRKTL
jgi:hypothetical protein